MRTKYLFTAFFLVVSSTCFAQSEVNLSSLLKEMISYDKAAQWPEPYYTEKQASSYDRRSVSPDKEGWFANDDRTQYIRTDTINGRKELVMMDVDGPGTIVRFWLTTFKRAGTIRVYFDGSKTAALTVPAFDLMKSGLDLGNALLTPHSSYEPKEKGGSNLYLPMPYAKHCKVTWEEGEKQFEPRYYQINYRTYKPGTKVKTFTMAQLKALKPLADAVNKQLLNPVTASVGKKAAFYGDVPPKKDVVLALPAGSAAIKSLVIKIDTNGLKDYGQTLRSAILNITFDGEKTVSCPLGDFGGSGFGGKPLASWYRTITADGTITSRWVMPYRRNAVITLSNKSGEALKVSITAVTGKWAWNANSMYFHTDWKSEANVPIKKTEQDKPIDWDFNTITGKGVFMGDALAVFNHMKVWYGEGDQKLWADGATFPDEFGTGTEDYYNTSWAPVVLYQTPFANAPRADNASSYGHNTFTRTRNLDRFTFSRSFRINLEMLGWENGAADFAVTTYWYGLPGAKSSVAGKK